MLIRVAVEHLEAATLVFARTAIGACVLLPVAAARGQLGPLLPRCRAGLGHPEPRCRRRGHGGRGGPRLRRGPARVARYSSDAPALGAEAP